GECGRSSWTIGSWPRRRSPATRSTFGRGRACTRLRRGSEETLSAQTPVTGWRAARRKPAGEGRFTGGLTPRRSPLCENCLHFLLALLRFRRSGGLASPLPRGLRLAPLRPPRPL